MMTVEAATLGTTFTVDEIEYTVAEKCDQNTGRWVCITHSEVFPIQLAKDLHISEGGHVLAWVCLEHGPEVP